MDIQKQTKMAEMLTKIKTRSDKCKQDLEDKNNGVVKMPVMIPIEQSKKAEDVKNNI